MYINAFRHFNSMARCCVRLPIESALHEHTRLFSSYSGCLPGVIQSKCFTYLIY